MAATAAPPRSRVLLGLLAFLLLVVVATNVILLHDRRGVAATQDLAVPDVGAPGWTALPAGRAVQTARTAAKTYFTLDYRTVRDDMDRMRSLGTPDFVADYDAGAADLVRMLTAEKRRLSARLPRDGTATEYAVTGRVIVLVSVDVLVRGPDVRESMRYRTRVSLDLVEGQWLVASLDEVA